MKKAKTNSSGPSQALVAVAYQDLLLQDMAIQDLSLSNQNLSYKHLKQKLHTKEKQRKKSLQKIQPKIDTGIYSSIVSSSKINKSDVKREYVLDPQPLKPNLAQKIGLLPLPPQPLSDNEWKDTKQKSIDRNDFENPCAICQDSFRMEDQVLLSCSHVFHKSCIQAFERFTGKKSCPMCRKMQYQSRVVYEGSTYYRKQCAIKIQSLWRGYVAKKWYRNLRRTIPPKDPKLRKVFYEDKLHEITNRMVAMTSGETVQRLINDVDESVTESRKIFEHFERTQLQRISEETWDELKQKAISRENKDCSICLQKLLNESPSFSINSMKNKHSSSSVTLLSCTHMFHTLCINSLEEFYVVETHFDDNLFQENVLNANRGSDTLPVSFKCPVCRSLYVKKIL